MSRQRRLSSRIGRLNTHGYRGIPPDSLIQEVDVLLVTSQTAHWNFYWRKVSDRKTFIQRTLLRPLFWSICMARDSQRASSAQIIRYGHCLQQNPDQHPPTKDFILTFSKDLETKIAKQKWGDESMFWLDCYLDQLFFSCLLSIQTRLCCIRLVCPMFTSTEVKFLTFLPARNGFLML